MVAFGEEVEDRGSVAADLVDFEVECVGGLTDGTACLEEGARDLAACGRPVGCVGDDEDEGGIVEASDGVADLSADLSWVELREACDVGGGLSVAVHRENKGAVGAEEVLGSDGDCVGEIGVLGASEVDGCGHLVEPIGLIGL